MESLANMSKIKVKSSFFNEKDRKNYLRLLSYLKPLKKTFLIIIVSSAIYGFTEPLFPWVMKRMIDEGFSSYGNNHFSTILLMVLAMNLIIIVRGTANFLSSYFSNKLNQKIILELRNQMFEKLQRLPMDYFHKNTIGSVISKFTYDVSQLTQAANEALINCFRDAITVIALLVYVFILDWKMTLTLMLATPAIAWFIVFISSKLRRLSRNLQADMGGINYVLDENLRARSVVRIYNGYEREKRRFFKQSQDVLRHSLISGRVAAMISPILELIIMLSLSLVIVLAATQDGSNMSTGKFVAFLGAMALLFPPIKRIGRVNEPLQRGLAAMESVFGFLDFEQEYDCPEAGIKIKKGEIEFRNVDFSYGDKKVLENFNLKIKAGESLALVGESGSGKSTIAALLTGFYQPQGGEIYLDGYPASKISQKERREAFSFVGQETVLFASSVALNIAYPNYKYDKENLKNSALAANALEFIEQLEYGFETKVGEAGNLLSGGQKQRISIARAIYKNAPILILDEATSALDSHSEKKVQEAIEHLQKDRTALIIAHRLSTIENADRIVVLQQGKIVEEGNHQSLLAKKGIYALLVNKLAVKNESKE